VVEAVGEGVTTLKAERSRYSSLHAELLVSVNSVNQAKPTYVVPIRELRKGLVCRPAQVVLASMATVFHTWALYFFRYQCGFLR